MEKPEMIIFDYGRTLICQPNYDTWNGNKAIYPYINRNPRNISFEEYDRDNPDFEYLRIHDWRELMDILAG